MRSAMPTTLSSKAASRESNAFPISEPIAMVTTRSNSSIVGERALAGDPHERDHDDVANDADDDSPNNRRPAGKPLHP
jgi:hypothetical protein